MAKNQLGDSCFDTVSLKQVLELLKGLDTTEVRAAKMLDSKDLDKLHLLKQSLVVVCLAYLSTCDISSDEVNQFLSYVLTESKVMRPELKNTVLLPPQQAPEYFKKLRAHPDTVYAYVESLITDGIEENWQQVNQVLASAEN